MLKRFLYVLFICCLGSTAFAQQAPDTTAQQSESSRSLVGPFRIEEPVNRFVFAGMGIHAYRGDLSASFQGYRPGVLLGVRWNNAKRLNSAFQFSYYQVAGQDASFKALNENQLPANNYFVTRVFGLQYNLNINILKREHLWVYVAPGLGLMNFSPKDEQNQSLVEQQSTRAEGEFYGDFALMFPSKVGVVYRLKNGLRVGLDWGLAFQQTDYIDNISELSVRSVPDNLMQVAAALYVPFNSRKKPAFKQIPEGYEKRNQELEKAQRRKQRAEEKKAKEKEEKEKNLSREEKRELRRQRREERRKERQRRIEELKRQREENE